MQEWQLVVVVLIFLAADGLRWRAPAQRRRGMALQGFFQQPNKLELYDGEAIDRYYRQPEHLPDVMSRLIDVGSPLLGWFVLKKFDDVMSVFRSDRERKVAVAERAEDLKDAIVAGGSIAFIKSGQALSLRPDLLKSPDLVRELQKLQDEVGTFPNDEAFEIMRNELGGRDPHSIFHFDPPTPIASASIGQVYKATIRSTNETVAVKVQRPDALTTAPMDMFILRRLAAYLRDRKKLRSNLVAIADEFGAQLWQELNYTQEACNAGKFKELYGEIPGILVPNVYPDLTRRRVLTMQFVEGSKGPWLRGGERMLTIGLQCSVLQLLGKGYFHSDPHRGNLLQTPQGELAYLDFGMMCDVPASRRYALIGTVLGLVNKDLSLVVDNLKSLELLPPQSDTMVIVEALNAAVLNATKDSSGSGSTLNFTQLNSNIYRASSSGVLPFSLPPFYTLIIRTLTILEGLALSVDPSFRLIRGAYPFIAKQILENPEPEMQALLKAVMVTPQGRIRWDKVEQFVSIASNADAAMAGNFSALKTAQARTDLVKTYSSGVVADKSSTLGGDGSSSSSNNRQVGDSNTLTEITFEVATTVLDFLLSAKGAFLREPLVDEIVETLDSIGLSAASLASYLSNGLVPRPDARPDRERIDQVLKLMSLVAGGESSKRQRATGDGIAATSSLVGSMQRLLQSELLNPALAPARIAKLQPLVDRVVQLLTLVAGRLASRGAKRLVQSVVSPTNVERALPLLASLLEIPFPKR